MDKYIAFWGITMDYGGSRVTWMVQGAEEEKQQCDSSLGRTLFVTVRQECK
jgi:hypothetical protein